MQASDSATWLTRAEVADRLKVKPTTLAQWACLGRGPKYALFGNQCRYRLSDLIEWEDAHVTRGGGIA